MVAFNLIFPQMCGDSYVSFRCVNAESGSYTLNLKGRWVYFYCRGHISSIKSSARRLKSFLAQRENLFPPGFD